MAENGKKMAAWALSVFRDRSPTTMITFYKSLIRSRLEYCCPLWNPSKVRDIITLESIQRAFTARINGCLHLHYWERLKKLKLMSLQRRRERYIIVLVWKILHQRVPNNRLNILNKLKKRPHSRGSYPQTPVCYQSLCHSIQYILCSHGTKTVEHPTQIHQVALRTPNLQGQPNKLSLEDQGHSPYYRLCSLKPELHPELGYHR